MIMKVTGLHQFMGEIIHNLHLSFTGHDLLRRLTNLQGIEITKIVGPDLGPEGEPAFPIAPPVDFLEKFFDRRKCVTM